MAAASKRKLLAGVSVLVVALAFAALFGLHGTVEVSDDAQDELSGQASDTPADTRRYALCRENVGSVSVVPTPGGVAPFAIAVQLEPAAAEEFARVTGESGGRMLEVVFGEWLLMRARIERSIRSGTLVHQAFASADDADGAARQLRAHLPESPCGIALAPEA